MTSWQDRFKKPSWQQTFTHFENFVYKPIDKNFSIKQGTVLLAEGIGFLGGHYFIRGHIYLKENGQLHIYAGAMTPAASREVTIMWDLTAEIKGDGQTILKRPFKNRHGFWPADDYTRIGSVDLNLPPPQFFNKLVLIISGGYTYNNGTGNASPLWQPQTSKEFPLDIIRKK